MRTNITKKETEERREKNKRLTSHGRLTTVLLVTLVLTVDLGVAHNQQLIDARLVADKFVLQTACRGEKE